MRTALLLLAGTMSVSLMAEQPPGPKWKLQFFHDKLNSTLIFEDIECPSLNHCVAVGAINSDSGKLHPTAVVTSDGGEHWTTVELKDTPYSVFFVNDSVGWIAAEKKIWRTEDGGLKWSDMSKLDQIEQLAFLDSSHGWAAGRDGEIYETTNSGKQWKKAPVTGLAWPNNQVAFQGVGFSRPETGFLIGTAFPYGQLRPARPDWLDPQRAMQYREPPAMSFAAVTKDGGQTWLAGLPFSKTGTVSNVHAMANGHALVTMRYPNGAGWPTAVLDVDPATGSQTVVYRQKDRVARDAVPLPGGGAMIAAIEPPGTATSLPIPGKLRMIQQDAQDTWRELSVDYRAVAANVLLASPDGKHFWAATDTGMILRFDPDLGTK